ncbi:MAG: LPS-assembly protein LptD [Gammaproteobacteria bacterium]|nr:LPS-assembly protein LptD [Gammaproteobacteria bacterium]MBU1644830.1 LPS-assembly protein LptD [Gammaproteobacteria bacterium]
MTGPLLAADEANSPVPQVSPVLPAPGRELLAVDPQLLAPLPEPTLRGSGRMLPQQRDARENYPNFISADRLHGTQDVETIAEGAVEMRTVGRSVDTDHLVYRPNDDEVEATGNVVLRRDVDVMRGPKMKLRLEDNVGYFEQPQYSISRLGVGQAAGATPVPGSGEAERMEFEGEGRYRMKKATYSTCSAENRDWFAEVDELSLDYNSEVGRATNARVMFGGVPILYSPWLSFSLNNQRKTGLLSPTFGSTSQGGLDYTQPWYWNIAPNMDATIAPRLIQKRGTQVGTEFRYLDRTYNGQISGTYLANDKVYNDSRWAYTVLHNQNLGYGFAGALNLNGVSDSRYLGDVSTRLALTSQTYLLRQGILSYGGGWWNASVNALRYQAPQTPGLVGLPELYKRLPQVNLSMLRPDLPLGMSLSANAEYVDFSHPTSVVGQRWSAYPQLAVPLQTAAFYVTPKIGVHATRYSLDRQAVGTPKYLDRTVPIASVDSGVTFERNVAWLGKDITQTLEPRLYYVNIPHRDQTQVPVFDTGLADFNFAQIFSENRYAGNDRIGDADQLTGMVTSRLIDPATGTEFLRGAIGQRYYFRDQTVLLPGELPRKGRTADLLATVSGQIAQRLYLDTGLQYNPIDERTKRFNINARFQPEPGHVINAGYRYTADQVGQFDVSAQWPIWGGWHGVGRYNYSTRDGRVIESVGGVEYDGGCWVARAVAQRIATIDNNSNTAVYVQLELNGFSRIGSNPLELLKRNIPGYGRINQPAADPVFAAN